MSATDEHGRNCSGCVQLALIAEAKAAGAREALMAAADEQERLAYGPRAMGSRAVAFKRLIFANWLRERAALPASEQDRTLASGGVVRGPGPLIGGPEGPPEYLVPLPGGDHG